MSRLGFLPVLVAIALYGVVGGPPILVGALALLLLVAQVVQVRLSLSRFMQIVIGLVLFGATVAVLVTAMAGVRRHINELSTPWAATAGAALLLAVSRSYFAEPTGGLGVTVAIALAALTACGGAINGAIYPAGIVLFLAAAAVALRESDPARAPWGALGDRRYVAAAVAMLAVTGGLGLAFVLALPPAHSWAVSQLMFRSGTRSGFSDKLQLGSMRDMVMSDTKVLRVYGSGADYLRGMTYTRYVQGRWDRVVDDRWSPTDAPEELGGDDVVEIQIISGDPKHYFVPLDAHEVAISTGVARVDRSAVLAPVAAKPATRILYRRDAPRRYPLAPPNFEELVVPSDVAAALGRVAREWTAGATSDADKLARIEAHLREDYLYSLEVEIQARRDPVVQFVLETKVGHCEYFASAMAIMSRLVGVPARVVGGYRVTERNELGGYAIVRERDAHAWVEAYLPERGWTTYDATPADATGAPAASTTRFLAAFADLFGAGYLQFLIWLDRQTIPEILALTGLVVLVPLLIRWLVERRRRRNLTPSGAAADPPLPCLELLLATLGARGIIKPGGETLEHLAFRAAASEPLLPTAQGDRAAALLRRYAALRYGGIGQEAPLDEEIRRFCHDLEAQA